MDFHTDSSGVAILHGPSTGGPLERTLVDAAGRVLDDLDRRAFDGHHRYRESLVSHLLCHELLTLRPALEPRVWLDYCPWPEESRETIDLWIDPEAETGPVAIEVRVGARASAASPERREAGGELVADLLKLATAVRYRSLRYAYELVFGSTRYLTARTPIGRLSRDEPGHTVRVRAAALHPPVGSLDWPDFEELMHPREPTPETLDLTLLERRAGAHTGFWLWAVGC